jgi:replication factor A1
MIAIPYEKIKQRIKEQTGMSEKDIDTRVKEKLDSLAGLISQDGAIHIIANELGVTLTPDRDNLKVKDLLPGMRGIMLNLRVVKKYELREFNKEGRAGKVASFLAGDETGVVRVTLWNEQTDDFAAVTEGMTVQLNQASVKENQNRVELHLGTGSELVLNPKGVVVNVNAGATDDRAYTIKKIGELTETDEFVDILGTIVQVFDPRTFTKKTGTEGVVTNAVIDDGSGTIRASFWDDDARTLLGESMSRPEQLADTKLELLGQIVKVQGRCKLNPTYNSLELSVSKFVLNPDPSAEMSRLG